MEYNKVQQEIGSVVNDNVKLLAQLFPSAVKDGEVDFEALKEELGEFQEVGSEKYELTWAGKQNAKKIVQEPLLRKTLKFIPEDSKNPEKTENIYIEGDNLEVLKLLKENYRGAIKMVYIDPPYNTGNDFIYNDNFNMTAEESDEAEGDKDELGERYKINSKSQNRYHANWLNMMYPRLQVAKDLLKDNGVIFIHIDDNELDNLRKISNEIFGEENYVNLISIKTKVAGVSGSYLGNSLSNNVENILMYAKNINAFVMHQKPVKKQELMNYINVMELNGKSWKYTQVMKSPGYEQEIKRFKDGYGDEIILYKHNDYEFKPISQIARDEFDGDLKKAYYYYIDYIFDTTNAQSSVRERVMNESQAIDTDLISIRYVPKSGKNTGNMIQLFYKGPKRRLFTWLKDTVSVENNYISKLENKGNMWDDIQFNNLAKEGDITFPNGKKPIQLLNELINMTCEEDDIVLDFFSGSASTAHAVMQNNVEFHRNLKYIMVQIVEAIDKNADQYKEGYRTICDIGKERIRRAGEKIILEHPEVKDTLDIGFKVFRVEDTNIKWNMLEILKYENISIEKLRENPDMMDFVLGANDIDIVYEIMLRQRDVSLSARLENLTDIGQRTYLYDNSYLVCLETDITEKLVDELSKLNPLPIKFIFRDSAFKDNIALKDETFRRLKVLVDKNSGNTKKTYTVEFI